MRRAGHRSLAYIRFVLILVFGRTRLDLRLLSRILCLVRPWPAGGCAGPGRGNMSGGTSEGGGRRPMEWWGKGPLSSALPERLFVLCELAPRAHHGGSRNGNLTLSSRKDKTIYHCALMSACCPRCC